jgi:thiol-disulfide isomerase/thioredoxin
MVDAPEPPAGAADDPVEQPDDAVTAPPRPRRRRRRSRLDARTVAICFVIALTAAIAAGLVASLVIGDDDQAANGELELAEAGDIVPDRLLTVQLTTSDGGTTDLDALRGGVTLVNFWQSSCAPCIREMPLLEEARADRPDITFLGVATQDRFDQALELAQQTGITYPWVQDPDGLLFFEAKGAGMPTTILLDEDGNVIATETGEIADRAELDAFLAKAD